MIPISFIQLFFPLFHHFVFLFLTHYTLFAPSFKAYCINTIQHYHCNTPKHYINSHFNILVVRIPLQHPHHPSCLLPNIIILTCFLFLCLHYTLVLLQLSMFLSTRHSIIAPYASRFILLVNFESLTFTEINGIRIDFRHR
jgi:hypothetical protein